MNELGTVVLDGFYGRKNAGDEAILASILQQIRSFDPNAKIIVCTFNTEYTIKNHDVDHVIQRWVSPKSLPSREWLSAVRNADQFWIGGGGLFGDFKMFKYATQISIARSLGTRVASISVGSGPIQSNSFRITPITLKHADALTVRDQKSKNYLRESGVSSPITVVADPVFGYGLNSLNENLELFEKVNEDKLLVVSVREPNMYDFEEQILASVLDQAIEQFECDIVFLPFHDEPIPDSLVAKRVNNQMASEAIVYDQPITFREIFHIIDRSRLLVGMRLHSIIFAARANTPFVGIPYAPKCESHLKQLNAESTLWCNSLDQELLFSEICNRWESGLRPSTQESIDELEHKVDNILPTIQSQNQAVPRLHLPLLFSAIGILGIRKILGSIYS